MNVFLVDFENVNSQGLSGINRLESSDQIVIFYSENADSMTFELHEQINASRAYIHFQKVDVGTKNALDFQLATYLGYIICENEKAGKEAYYYVVTKDHGFSSLVTYWTKRGIDIALVGSLSSGKIGKEQEISTKPAKKSEEKKSEEKKPAKKKVEKSEKKGTKKKQVSPEEQELRIQVEKVVSDQSIVDLVVSYIQKYKTKLGINNALAKEFKDSKKASEIYKSIKPLIADKKGQ